MSTGLFNTSQFTQDLAAKSFAGMITRLMPNGFAPLFGLTAMLQTETALQIEHGFFTKTMLFPQLTDGAAGQTATDTTFGVTNTNNVLPGMIMQISSTGENIIINAVNSATSVNVTRAVGTVAAQVVGAGAVMYQVGNAFEEASLRPNALIINPVRIINLTQIFRNTWAISGTVQATKVIAGDTNVQENRQDCAAFHAADIEKALFFGQQSQSTRNGQPFRTMDGLINIVSNPSNYPPIYNGVPNTTTFGSTTTFTQLENALDPMFNQTTDPKIANQRLLFVGGTAKKVLNNIARLNSSYFVTQQETTWGLQFSTLNIARGSFNIIEHPLFNSNSTWAKIAVGVDLSTFRLAYLGGRKTQAEDFGLDGRAADNGQDAVGGTFTTECTCVVKNPPANFYGSNLTAGATG